MYVSMIWYGMLSKYIEKYTRKTALKLLVSRYLN